MWPYAQNAIDKIKCQLITKKLVLEQKEISVTQ